jgi:hypothetical protein
MIFRLIYSVAVLIALAGIARAEAVDALEEVNNVRRSRGLPPFVKCPQLTAGALNVAQFRADRRIVHHTANDFSGLPVGTSAAAAGCGVEYPGFGFLACCMMENWTIAGAAKARDSSGRWYFHLFVNGGSGVSQGRSMANASFNARRRR